MAVCNALKEWDVIENVKALCCDTTASNTGRLSGACVLIEQHLEKDLLYLPCRHHIYEIVLRAVFEVKIPEASNSPEVTSLKKFQKKWNTINPNKITPGMEDQYVENMLEDVKSDVLYFCYNCLDHQQIRGDYKELVELVVLFLNGEKCDNIKIHPPGAAHHARWMARAIYAIKMYLFRKQYMMTETEETSIRDVCIFVVKYYVKYWFSCTSATIAPRQDLNFIHDMIMYMECEPDVAKAAIAKICNHLWYLSDEARGHP